MRIIPDFWDQDNLSNENSPIKINDEGDRERSGLWIGPDIERVIPQEVRRACDGSKWVLDKVLSPSGNKNLYHIHPTPKSKKDLLLPAPTYTLLFRQELYDSQDRAILAHIENRARLNEILARIEGKYLDKIAESLKNNHFMQGLSKSAILKFVLDGTLGKGYGEILL
jgi:hypothetical protein